MESHLPIAAKLSQTLEEYSIVAITDQKGIITHVNNNFCKISKYSREELIGKDHRIINSGYHPKSFFKKMWETISTGEVWHGEIKNRAKDGIDYWVDTHIVPFYDEKGNICEYVAIRVDITEKKVAKEMSRLQKEQLQHADKLASIGILTTGVAHEINNPNQLILSNTETLMMLCQESFELLEELADQPDTLKIGGLPFSEIKAEIPEMLTRIREGSIRIKKIVDNLKNYAKKEDLEEKTSVNLNIVVKSALVLVESWIKKSTDHFELDLHEDLPTFQGLFHQIEQVVINLITNACQSLQHRDQKLQIKTCVDTSHDIVTLEVKDEGQGIKQSDLTKIFDPFFTTKRDTGGTGLGLYISHAIVQQHEGRLEFSSEEGLGTTVKLHLPTHKL